MPSDPIFLELKWSVSRGRETYGYNICTLTDTSTGKRFRCNGGGYDMIGTVFGEWLQETYQDALQLLAHIGRAHDTFSTSHMSRTRNEKGLYGLTRVEHNHEVTRASLDGACGIESMRRIAEAIGLHVKSVSNHKGRQLGFIVSGDES